MIFSKFCHDFLGLVIMNKMKSGHDGNKNEFYKNIEMKNLRLYRFNQNKPSRV